VERFRPLEQRTCQQQLGWDVHKFHVLFPTNGGDPVKRFDLARAAVNLLQASGVQTELHQLCGIENKAVPVWLNASDVLLLTSLHEGSPTVVKEALACDVPVVSVNVGDVKERISSTAGCYLSEPNTEDLASKLAMVRSRGARVQGRTAVQELSLERVALRLKSLYDEIAPDINARTATASY
jgi:glycosyltransferase involved in cell wall biosynthesis